MATRHRHAELDVPQIDDALAPVILPLNFGEGRRATPELDNGDGDGTFAGDPSTTGLAAFGGGSATSSSSSSSSSSASSSFGDPVDVSGVERADYSCVTGDGVRLHLVRGTCAAAAAARPRAHPVILIPGLASSAEATWDVLPQVSLFNHLVLQGYDVWLLDLRGGRALAAAGAW